MCSSVIKSVVVVCVAGMMCVGENFCDKFGEVSSVFLLLNKAEKDQRGKLIVSEGELNKTKRIIE